MNQMTDVKDAKRQEIKDRITAAQERNAERQEPSLGERVSARATAARDDFTAFAKEHPVATVAGGLAIGVLISALFKNSPTRKAGRYAGAKAAGYAAIGSQMAAAFAEQLMESTAGARQASADKLEDVGDAFNDTARRVRRTAEYRAANASDTARNSARDIGKTIARTLRRH